MVLATAIAVLLLKRDHTHVLFALFITAAYGAIGFLDDLLKTLTRSSLGLKSKTKAVWTVFYCNFSCPIRALSP